MLNVERVLFVTPPSAFTAYTGTRVNAGVQHYPLLSYLYCSSYVKKHVPGIRTHVLDLGIEKDPWHLFPRVLAELRPQVLAMTCTTPMFFEVRLLTMIAKAVLGEGVCVVIGGVHVSAKPAEALIETMADVVVREEGEVTFGEVCEGRPFSDIKGIAFREDTSRRVVTSASVLVTKAFDGHPHYSIDGMTDDEKERKIRINLPRRLMTNAELDGLPFPDLELYDIWRYKNPAIIARGYPLIQVETSRGCPFKCDFCSSEDQYRVFSPERVVDEFEAYKKYGIKEIRIIDDQFAVSIKRAKKIFTLMAERGLTSFHLNLANGVRADRLDLELLLLGKRVGLYQVGIGFESGDQASLDSMHKGLADGISSGFRTMKLIREAGLECVGFFILGAAGDTESSLAKTIRYAKALGPDYAKATVLVPFPDTRLYADFRRRGLIKSKRWDLYNIHKAEEIYTHPNGLKPEVLRYYYNLFYREYYLLNFPFMVRRLWKSVRNGSLFLDIYYALKTFLPSVVPGNPRGMNLRPLYMYHAVRRWIFGAPQNGQIS